MLNYWYDHVHLTSLDPLKTAEFYEKMFDAKRVDVRELADGRTIVGLDLKGASILVMHPKVPPKSASSSSEAPYGLDHFGLKTDNIEASVAELKANGVKFKEEIRTARPGVKVAFFWAPEGVLIELVERESP